MKKIAVIGHFGFGKNLLNGQTIKTKILTEALKEQLGEENITCIDTHGGVKALIKIIVKIYAVLKKHDDIIMLPAHNGVLIFSPLLSFFNKFTKKNLHYIVIGGWLPEYLDKHKITAKLLKNNFRGIYAETSGMKDKLQRISFENVVVMPNCKHLNIVENPIDKKDAIFKLCTFSRVMKEKGIEDAINAVTQINEEAGRTICTLDIFGQVDSSYAHSFGTMKENFPEYINYGGLIEYSKSTEVLKEYYALLFPTFYDGEGFAGTIIDAFAAGIPVIASDWRYNAEVVEHMKTGLIYPHKNVDELKKSILTLFNNTTLVQKMKENCVKEAKNYLPEKVINILLENISD